MPVDHKKLAALAPKQPEPPKKGNLGEDGDTPDVKAIIKQVDDDGKGDPKLMELAEEYDPESGEEPNFVADDDTWGEAMDLVEPYFDELVEPYAVVLHVYREMGGKLVDEPDDKDDDEEEPEEDGDNDQPDAQQDPKVGVGTGKNKEGGGS